MKRPLNRVELLTAADRILSEALQRINNKYTKNPEKIKWSRVAVQAISVANSVLRDEDLAQLEARIDYLEHRMNRRIEDRSRINMEKFTPEERDIIINATKLIYHDRQESYNE